MVSSSFQLTSFLGGEWSPTAQGRMTDPNYQRGMNVCFNGMPIEEGSWTRRPGFRFLGLTRHGAPAKLFQFDFSTTQPYQIELTDGFLRLWAGLALVMADNPNGYSILTVTADNPGKVFMSGMPNTWANGDTVVFFINSEPCSAPFLCNQQFTIANINTDAQTFTLQDAVTGADIDGATIAYEQPLPGDQSDTVAKVFELATPYVDASWQAVRTVHNDTQVTLFHPKYAPQTLAGAIAEPFALTTQVFTDGPYLDINTTTTTLTPSGVSGSITITASSTIGINGNDGFKSTDVGRALRFQSAPPAWSSLTSYKKSAQVTGSDGNIYEAISKNSDIDPTADDGTNWLLVGASPTWVWMTITAVTDITHVTATVNGAASNPLQTPTILGNTLASTSPQLIWQLGFFSNTDGWPTLGAYNQGRLWLANAIQANRFDGSASDDYFNYCPTASDGTVSDGNAIAAVLNADEVNAVFWMVSLQSGLTIGTQGAEWSITASQLNDPITPTSIQAYRMSTFGSADVEALKPWNRVLFIQRHARKLLALRQAGEAGFDADNVSHLAQQIMAPGIAEIRWQQEPTLTVWLRRNDGTLAGMVYRSSAYSWSYGQSQAIGDENFAGFFRTQHAYNRSFVSISTGPAYDGLSSALYAVTNQPDATKPDVGVHHVEYLMPLFDETVEDWGAFLVDGGATPCCARKFLVANGDGFDGLRLYGLNYLNGLQTSVVIGGLDIGDFSVANGYVDVPFAAPFTEAFFNALDNGTDYGQFATDTSFVTTTAGVAPPYPTGTIGSWVNASETHGNFTFADLLDGKFYGLNSEDGFFDVFDYTTFALVSSTALSTVLDGDTFASAAFCVSQDGFVYTTVTVPGIAQINPVSNTRTGFVGTTGEGMAWPDARQFLPFISPVTFYDDTGFATLLNIIAVVGITSASQEQRVSLLDCTHMQFITNSNFDIAEDYASLTNGAFSPLLATFYILGRLNNYAAGDTVSLTRATVGVSGGGNTINSVVTYLPLMDIAPSDIDPTWTTFSVVTTPVFCASDGTLICGFSCTDVVTNKEYLLKYDPNKKTIVWQTALPLGTIVEPSNTQRARPINGDYYGFYEHGSGSSFYRFHLTDGSFALSAFPPVFLNLGATFYDENDGGIVVFNPEWAWVSPPDFLGTWSNAHGASGNSSKASKIYLGFNGSSTHASRQYHVPSSIGLTYTSQGQTLRPDFGPDAGARNGPAFGKKRRLHWYAASLYRTQGIKFGTDFRKMRPASLLASATTPVVAPALFSDIFSTTIDNDYSFNGQIAWQIERPYPAMIVALGGYIEAVDK